MVKTGYFGLGVLGYLGAAENIVTGLGAAVVVVVEC